METNGTEAETEKFKESDDEESNNENIFEEYLENNKLHTDNKRRTRSALWEFFEVVDLAERLACCTLCQTQLSYKTTSSNLAKHLKRKHFIEFVKNEDDGDVVREQQTSRRNSSKAWEYFEITNRKQRIATCKLCGCLRSYWSSVSNLNKHVRRKHGGKQTSESIPTSPKSCPDSPSPSHRGRANRSKLWDFFKTIDTKGKMAECRLCQRHVSYKANSNMKRHLQKRHPECDLRDDTKRVIISRDGQLYEIEDSKDVENSDTEEQPTIDIDSVFINDDFDGDVLETRSKKRKLNKDNRKSKVNITCSSDDTSSDEITFQKRYVRKKSDSLARFGQYLVSLLKELPKELSNQLQMDFVKQVLTTQLTYDVQKKGAVPSNGYAITITGDGSQNMDHQYVTEEVVQTE